MKRLRWSVLALAIGASASRPAVASGGGPVPWVDRRAAGALDGDPDPAPTLVVYRVDATVRLQLIIGSIPIASRDSVGTASFTTQDITHPASAPGHLLVYEFFAASFPERARRLNRLGFLREVVQWTSRGADWTAHFGMVSSDRAQTREEGERSLDKDEDIQPYSILDGLIEPEESFSTVVRLRLPGRWTDGRSLYADIEPLWSGRAPDDTHRLANRPARSYEQPLGFLGGLQASLHSVTAMVARGEKARGAHQPYVHNGRVYRFELTGIDADTKRGREYARVGWIKDGANMRRLSYRIVDADGDTIEDFQLWVEITPGTHSEDDSSPIVPLAFAFMPRSFLELRAERVDPADVTRTSSQ
jgi:hypothetical protein